MTRHIGRDYLQLRNSLRLAQWQWRWHLQGGSQHFTARDLMDLRNDAELARWRRTRYRLHVRRAEFNRARKEADWFERAAADQLPAFLTLEAD